MVFVAQINPVKRGGELGMVVVEPFGGVVAEEKPDHGEGGHEGLLALGADDLQETVDVLLVLGGSEDEQDCALVRVQKRKRSWVRLMCG